MFRYKLVQAFFFSNPYLWAVVTLPPHAPPLLDKMSRCINTDGQKDEGDESQLLEWQIHNKREWQILRCPTGIRSCWKRAVYRLLANDRHHFPVLFFSFVLLKQLCLLLQSFSSSLSVDTFPLFINFILVYMIVCMHICIYVEHVT